MKATVIRSFLRNEREMLPGQTFDCPDNEFHKWVSLGFVRPYETKVVNPEKKTPSELSQVDRAQPRKTRKKSRKYATK